MLTRDEELYNLREMKQRITKIKNLEECIEERKKDNDYQKQRTVDDYPAYVSKGYVRGAELDISLAQETRQGAIGWLLLIPPAIWGILCSVKLHSMGNGFFSMLAFVLFYFLPLIAGPFTLYIIPIIVHSILGLLLMAAGDIIYRNQMTISVAILIAMIILRIVSFIPFKTKRERKMLRDAKEKEKRDWNEYVKNKELGEQQISKQREDLSIEVSNKIADNNTKIKEIELCILSEAKLLATIPGLADQDKNEYTINKLITYFERGKADSIKEAINLYDSEERERIKEENERSWQRYLYREQLRAERERKKLIEQQDEEKKRQYNELKRIENERNEKIDDFIDDLKRKLDE